MTLALFPPTPFCVQWMSARCTQISHMGKVLRPVVKLWRDNPTPSATFICNLIEHILTLNYFQFEDNMWLQKHGMAMGTCMAPSYANLFMGALDEKMLETSPEKPIIWLR